MRKKATADGIAGIWLPIVVILALLAAGGAIYWRHHDSSKNNQPAAAGKTATANNAKPKAPTVSQPKGASSGGLTISELGVKVNVPDSLNGLTYTVTTAPGPQGGITTVQFIMKSYSTLANQCAGVPDTTAHPFANLSKASGSQPANVIKSFPDYSIVNSGSSVPPNASCKDAAVQKQLTNLGNQLTAGLQAMFQSAQKI